MIDEIWECQFTIHRLVTPEPVTSESISYSSPAPPLSEDKAYTSGKVRISSSEALAESQVVARIERELVNVFALTELTKVSLEVSIPNLINKDEIEKARQPRTAYSNLRMCLGCIGKLRDYNKIPGLWDKYQKMQKKGDPELILVVSWFSRAIRSESNIDKFINAWVTFNMLYSWLTGEIKSMPKGIRGLIEKGVPDREEREDLVSKQATIIEKLSQIELLDAKGNINKVKELRKALDESASSDTILELVTIVIGDIRNHLFHGGIIDRSKEVALCAPFVIDLVSRIIKHQLNKI
ncbi:MAG: hypothetical protein GX654_19250 [Desulfatiglans sp.]|nr:hypothetical protein [Desulfatiglans sp.]